MKESELLKKFLGKPDIHNLWEDAYRTQENERFFENALDYITTLLNAPQNATFLDVGCGICAHSRRLANRGFFVQAIDFSEKILEMAENHLQDFHLKDRIKIQRENILSLTFEDEIFDYILCWGVLMHISELENAISELTRVLKPGGMLVISEGNMFSLQSVILRTLKRLSGKERAVVKRTPAGLEYWTTSSNGLLLTREANIGWLKERFMRNGFAVQKHIAGQFSELYTRFSSRLVIKFIHLLNMLWFRYITLPYPAFGNIIILKKQK